MEASKPKFTAVGQELDDTLGLITLTVGSGLNVRGLPWTVAVLLISNS